MSLSKLSTKYSKEFQKFATFTPANLGTYKMKLSLPAGVLFNTIQVSAIVSQHEEHVEMDALWLPRSAVFAYVLQSDQAACRHCMTCAVGTATLQEAVARRRDHCVKYLQEVL